MPGGRVAFRLGSFLDVLPSLGGGVGEGLGFRA